MSNDCPRPMTGRERREYNAQVRALGGESSPEGKAFIEREHKAFKAVLARRNRQHGFWHSLCHG